MINPDFEQDRQNRARGAQSERNAQDAISELNWVKYVTRSQTLNSHDKAQRDLLVGTHSLVQPLSEVYVQVKSSDGGIQTAVQLLQEDLMDLWDW